MPTANVNVDDPTVPVACAPPTAPDLAANSCNPALNYGPISNLYIATNDPTAGFTGPPTAVELARRLMLPLTDVQAIRLLIGTLSFGSGTAAVELFNGVNYPKPTILEYPVETKDTSPQNYEFARQTQKGGYKCRVFGVSQDGQFWYGGQNGIKGVLSLRNVLPTDFTAAQSITGNLSVKTFFDPNRMASPVPAV